jgi:hypothetical protein
LSLAASSDRHVTGAHPAGHIVTAAPAPAAASIAPAPGAAPSRSYLQNSDILRSGEFIVADKRNFYLTVTDEGSVQVRKGAGPLDDFGVLWSSPRHPKGAYFLAQDPSGLLAVHRGAGPAGDQGLVWQSGGIRARHAYFAVIQDDGNLCEYAGQDPGDNRGHVWCSGKTAPVTWIVGGKKLVADDGELKGDAMYWGQFHNMYSGPDYTNHPDSPKELLMIPTLYVAQRWVFLPDSTIRYAPDRHYCLGYQHGYDRVQLVPCGTSRYTRGWYFNASDRSIRNRGNDNRCIRTVNAGGVDPQVWFFPGECALDDPPTPRDGLRQQMKTWLRWRLE